MVHAQARLREEAAQEEKSVMIEVWSRPVRALRRRPKFNRNAAGMQPGCKLIRASKRSRTGSLQMKNNLAFALFATLLLQPALRLGAQQTPIDSTVQNALLQAAAEQIPNQSLVHQQLLAYHACTCSCGCYARDLEAETNQAALFLRKRVAAQKSGEKLALVLDIDETSLSNWDEMLREDFTYHANSYSAWELSARSSVLPGTLALFQEAKKLGVAVFFITGRPEAERAATVANLKQQGYEGWQELTLRAPHTADEATSDYKSAARARIVAKGYTLAVNVGDQWSDLHGSPQAELNLKLPNPFYLIP